MPKGGKKSMFERAPEKNKAAVEGLLGEARTEKNEWLKKPVEWQKANQFVPVSGVMVCRITSSPSNEWFSVTIGERKIQVTSRDGGILNMLQQLCKPLRGSHESADMWPVVAITVPAAHSSIRTGEVLGVLDAAYVKSFKEVGFKVPTGSAEDDLFDREEEINVEGL
jgi:hypothetical protein